MKRAWASLPVRVKALIGGKASRMRLGDVDVAVCTIESACAMLNRCLLLRPGQRDDALTALRCVVIDEAHVIDSPRGAVLECLVAKLRVFDRTLRPTVEAEPVPAGAGRALGTPAARSLQVVAMSATLPGVEVVARWLGASLFRGDLTARPRPIREIMLRRGRAFTPRLQPTSVPWRLPAPRAEADAHPPRTPTQAVRRFSQPVPASPLSGASTLAASSGRRTTPRPPSASPRQPADPDAWRELVLFAAARRIPTLVFCPTKKQCEVCCSQLALAARSLPVSPAERASREQVQRELLSCLVPSPPGLLGAAAAGTAFHHGDLSNDSRRAVEEGFRAGALVVVFATSTLSNGVNLPADWVVFRTPNIAVRRIGPAEYTQMSGRAGRGLPPSAAKLASAASRPPGQALSVVILDSCSSCGVGRGFSDDALSRLVAMARHQDPAKPLPDVLCALREQSGDAEGSDTTADRVLQVAGLFTHRLPPLRSGLDRADGDIPGSPLGIRRLVLEAVAAGLACGPVGLLRVMRETLFWAQCEADAAKAGAGAGSASASAAAPAAAAAASSAARGAEPSGRGSAAWVAGQKVAGALRWLVGARMLETCDPRLAAAHAVAPEPAPSAVEGRAGGTGAVALALRATRLGTAAVASSMPPEEAVRVASDLERVRHSGLSMRCGGLHAIFFLTPIFRTQAPVAGRFAAWADETERAALEGGPDCEAARVLDVAARVGVTPASVRRSCRPGSRRRAAATPAARRGNSSAGAQLATDADEAAAAEDAADEALLHRRFWSALLLHGLATSADPGRVCAAFGVQPGSLGRLQEDSATFCAMVLSMCTQLGWKDLRLALGAYADRIVGAGRDEALLALMRVDGVNNARAKALADAGMTSEHDLASAHVADVEEALANGAEFVRDSGEAIDAHRERRLNASRLVQAARRHVAAQLAAERALRGPEPSGPGE